MALRLEDFALNIPCWSPWPPPGTHPGSETRPPISAPAQTDSRRTIPQSRCSTAPPASAFPAESLLSSITSSCTSVARCTISMITAAVGGASLVTGPHALAVSATRAGRKCLPLPFKAYSA